MKRPKIVLWLAAAGLTTKIARDEMPALRRYLAIRAM
jgi:hypothetical protein